MKNMLWGIVLIVVGIVLGLNALDITDIDLFFDGWWTLFIIIPCFIDLFKDKDKTGNIVGLVIGIFLLLSCQELIDFSILWKMVVPVVLILIGLSFIFKNTFNDSAKKIKEINSKNRENDKEILAVFSSQKVNTSDEKFEGASISCVFGGVSLDLREAKITSDIVINATSVFGGIDILVSDNVTVKVNSTSIFGGVDNKRENNSDNRKIIYVNATCLFGGVDIK